MAPLDDTGSEDVLGDRDPLARAAVIHDVNQMLAVITGRAELMLHRGGPSLAREDVETIALAATDAAAMLKRLSGPSATEARTPPCCSVAAEVRNTGLLVRPPDGKPWVDAGPDRESGGRVLDIRVAGDLKVALPGQVLREVLANLFLNALEAMPEGGGLRVTGSVRADRMILEVADEGPGLDPGTAELIFQAGVSGHDRPGRGLGLPGCRRLLAGFGAALDLAAGDGPGAVFRMELPVAGPDEEGIPGGEEQAGAEGPNVLVVDDEPGVRGMLADLLGEMGCRTSVARNAASARAVFAPDRFDVILLDQTLPDGTGRELAAEIRVRDPFVSVVLMTGLDRSTEIEDIDTGQVDLTAVKPLTWDEIRRLVDRGAALKERRRKTGEA